MRAFSTTHLPVRFGSNTDRQGNRLVIRRNFGFLGVIFLGAFATEMYV